MTSIERDVRFLKRYATISTIALLGLAVAAFGRNQRAKFEAIDVGRINVVEPDGKYRMVISNRAQSSRSVSGQCVGFLERTCFLM